MGTASAIPDHLATYSDSTVRGSSALQAWVRKVLVPAIEQYRTGARDVGGDIRGLTESGTTAGHSTVAEDVLANLTAILETDRPVRRVGDAFARADRGGKVNTTTTAAEHARQGLVTTTDQKLDLRLMEIAKELDPRQIELSQQQGRELAEYVRKHGLDQHARDELAKHRADGYYTSTFFNGLDERTLRQVLTDSRDPASWQAVIDAVASAYRVRSVDPGTTEVLVSLILRANPALAEDLFRKLKDDPAAANGFAHSLSDEQLRLLSIPSYYTSHITDTSWPQRQMVANFVEVLAIAVRSDDDPAWAQHLGFTVIDHVTGEGVWTATDEIIRSLTLLFGAIISTEPPPPPGTDSTDWARRLGDSYANRAIQIHEWLDQANKATDAEFALWFAVLTANPELTVANTAARRILLELAKWATGEGAKHILLGRSTDSADDAMLTMRAAAYLVAFTKLVESGQVTQTLEYRDGRGNELNPPRRLHPPRVLRVPTAEPARTDFLVRHCRDALAHYRPPGYYVGSPHPKGGEPTEVNSIFEAIDGRFDPADPGKIK